jgi:hypothetical protein
VGTAEAGDETYLTAWGAAVNTGHLAGRNLLPEICCAVRVLPLPPGEPRPLDLLLEGLALLTTDGRSAATPTLQRAATMIISIPVEDVLRWGWAAAAASGAVWDPEGMDAISARNVQLIRDAGPLAELPQPLTSLGPARAWMGDFAGATSLVAEAERAGGGDQEPIRALHRAEAAGSGRERSRGFCTDSERDRTGGGAHGGMASAQGVHQAPHQLPATTPAGPLRSRPTGRDCLAHPRTTRVPSLRCSITARQGACR